MALRAGFHGTVGQPSAQVIDGSLKFNDSANQHLKRTISAGNRRTFTLSAWVKHSTTDSNDRLLGNYTDSNNYSSFYFRDTPDFQISFVEKVSSTFNINAHSRRMARDTGWYHIVWVIDTTQSTDTDRVKLYVNGVQETLNASYSSGSINTNAPTLPSQNYQTRVLAAYDLRVGSRSGTDCWDGLMSQFYVIDGQALGPENFGFTDPLTNTWRPKKYTGDFNIASSDYTGVFAPYSASARLSTFTSSGTVAENATGYTLPMSNPSHYGGKVLNGGSGGFYVDTVNSATEDFFMGCWVKIDTLVPGNQIGVNIEGNYKYFELRSSGVIGIRHNGGGRSDSSNTSVGDGNWHHIALSRSGNTLYGFVDGTSVVTTTAGVSGNTISANERFNFFAASTGSGYNLDGQMIDAFVYIGQGVSSNFTVPTAPLIGSSGSINHYSGFSDSQLYYASPLVTVSGSSPNGIADYIQTGVNSFYLPMDGNSPIGQDKSGNGNDWTPVNFGGSNSIEKATGALPILNTDGGGNVARVGVKTDAYHANLVLALPLVGSANDVSNQINSGSTTKSMTSEGDVAASTAQSNFYGGSYYFDGTGDYIHTPDSADYAMGTGDFTVEMWINPAAGQSGKLLFAQANGSYYGWCNFYFDGGALKLYTSSDGNSWNVSNLSFGTPPGNAWSHVAVTRSGSTFTTYLNGVIGGTATNSDAQMDATGTLQIGARNGTEFYTGYIQDVRIYKGIAKYGSGSAGDQVFIPASTNPDILPDTPSGVSGGSKLTKITDGAVSFDGNDSLTISDSTDFDFGSNNFCCELWFYLTTVANDKTFIGNYANNNAFQVFIGGSGGNKAGMQLRQSGGTYKDVYTTTSIGANRWYHLACVREGSDTKVYLNGKLENTTDFGSGAAIDSNADMTIGNRTGTTANGITGFISNLRLVNGSSVYTSNFTPPTRELTNVTNTKLLCCQSNTSAVGFSSAPGDGVSAQTYSSGSISAGTPANASGSGGWAQAFDGNTSTLVYNSQSNTTMTLTLPQSVSFTKLEVYAGKHGSSNTSIFANGVNLDSFSHGLNGSWQNVTSSVTSPLTSLGLQCNSSSESSNFRAIRINDTILVNAIDANGDASATNFNPFNTDINTVRGQETGYCTANPLDKGALDLSNGNLRVERTSDTTDWETGRCTIKIPDTGRWYWEMTLSAGSNDGIYTGVGLQNAVLSQEVTGFWAYNSGGYAIYNTSYASSRPSMSVGDTACVSFDRDNNKMWVLINGATSAYEGNPYSGTDPNSNWRSIPSDVYPVVGARSTGVGDYNFGQKPFKFPPPDGFQPLNDANTRPETVIARPDQYVGTTTWSGNNVDGREIDMGMAPDLIWVKARNQTNWNWLTDTVRGAPNKLYSNDTAAQDTAPIYGQADSFTYKGWIAGGGTDGSNPLSDSNQTGTNYVCWAWRAGGSKNTFNVDDVGYASAAAAGLTAGTITPTGASVGTKQGFSIISYTSAASDTGSAQIPHGLSQTPDMVIIKNRDWASSSKGWPVWHSAISTGGVFLDNTDVSEANNFNYFFNNTASTSTVVNVSSNGSVSSGNRYRSYGGSDKFIMYAWHNVPGLQKFGSYEGNTTEGAFVELGFRPAIIWIKAVDQTWYWNVHDNQRGPINPIQGNFLRLDSSATENAGSGNNNIDFLSNGFKIRSTTAQSEPTNVNAQTYIYCAWAEAPASNLYGGQSNAR